MKFQGLNKKILFGITILILVLGLTIAFTAQAIIFKVLKDQFKANGINQARSIAANGLVDILTLNRPRLKKLLENESRSKPSIAYIFVVGPSNRVLAHTFKNGFPKDLLKANRLSGRNNYNIQLINTGIGIVYDIAVPVLLDRSVIGQIRIGIKESGIWDTMMPIDLAVTIVTICVIFIGIFLAQGFSMHITQPLSRLVEGIEAVRRGDFSAQIDIKNNDEIGILAKAFNEMAGRLNGFIEETRSLAKFKERERIALDLHDGVAQNLVSIIKRVELCEKLIKADPEEALQELKVLKFKTKDIVNETRQTIFDIRSREEAECGLTERLNLYLKDYEKINNIKVKINADGAFDDIPKGKCASIFYIITEALNNAGKHSLAKNVALEMSRDADTLRISVRDDGHGFDAELEKASGPRHGKYGLAGIYQRAEAIGARLKVHSEFDKGSVVELELALKKKNQGG